MYRDEGSWAPNPPCIGGPPGMPGRPCPAEPKDFPTLELTEPPGTTGGVWGGTKAGPPSVGETVAAGGVGCG